MASYIYLTNPAKLKSFLPKIQDTGIPPKLTIKHLKGMGFKSSNDVPLISAMKALGFVSPSREPTEIWKLYRDKGQAPTVLARAIKQHYAELYQMYPDAHLKDTEALRNFFSTHTTVSGGTLNFMIGTFKTLVGLANFDEPTAEPIPQTSIASTEAIGTKTQTFPASKSELVVNVNIQLTLPDGSTPDTFEAFFKAMRKHLFD